MKAEEDEADEKAIFYNNQTDYNLEGVADRGSRYN